MWRTFSQIALFITCALFASSSANGQDKLPPAPKSTGKLPGAGLTGAGGINPRTSVSQTELPWSAVGRLMAGRSSCTASLVGPSLLLTAAHCVFDPQTQRPFPAQALHFMLGYSQGRYVAEAWGVRLTTADTYDPTRGTETSGDDWAVVELGQPIGTAGRTLALSMQTPAAGDAAALGGYSQERIELLMVDGQCHVVGSKSDANGVPLIHHDCTANHGVSGAPLLVREGAAWVIGGIEAIGSSPNDGGAVRLDGARAALARLAK